MAEAQTAHVTKLRTFAEAYERICFSKFDESEINKKVVYGLGVGFRLKSALLRAYGEYHERYIYSTLDLTTLHAGSSQIFIRNTKYGSLYVCILKDSGSNIGSGYGVSEQDARESALRSALRKQYTRQNLQQFDVELGVQPNVYELSNLVHRPWLYCILVAHKR